MALLSSATQGTVQMDGCLAILVWEEPLPVEQQPVDLVKVEWRLVALICHNLTALRFASISLFLVRTTVSDCYFLHKKVLCGENVTLLVGSNDVIADISTKSLLGPRVYI